jgi:YD repeat-containing protein
MGRIFSRAARALAVLGLLLQPLSANAETYAYDALARLIAVSTDDYRTINYSYDAAGNRVAVSVTNTAPPPSAGTYSVSTNANQAKTFDPRSAASSPVGLSLSVTGIGTPAHGSASLSANQVTFTPTASYVGSDSFSYTVTDANGGTATGSINVTINDVPPTAGAYSVTTNANTAATFDPRASASSPIGLPLTISSVGTPGHGTASTNGSSVTYTPANGYAGPDGFTYTVSDGKGGSATGTVNATVNAAPALSVSVDSTYQTVIVYSPTTSGSSPNVTATASGGTGSYTYSWQYVSGDTGITSTAPNSPANAWTRSGMRVNQTYIAVWQCRVTDSGGHVAYSAQVTIEFDESNLL